MDQFHCVKLQLKLSRRNGTHVKDYGGAWWDEMPVEGIVTSSIRIDILSRYVEHSSVKFIEIELYSGQGESAFDWLAVSDMPT